MYLSSLIYTKIFGIQIGQDIYGNKYYENRSKNKRWVRFHKIDETSKVPQLWHAWLHHIIDNIPQEEDLERYDWQKNHLPNTTGTGYFKKKPQTKKIFDFWQP